MDLAEFAALDDWTKLVIVEIELSRKLQEETWTQSGAPNTNAWYIAMPNDGEVHKVVLDGSELTEKFTVALCHATASTFYYDDLNKTLYIHTSGSDDPKTLSGSDPKYSIVAYFNEFFSNRAKTLEPFEDALAEANGSLEFWDSATNAEDWTESLAGTSTVAREATSVYGSESAYSAKLTVDGGGNDVYITQVVSLPPRRKARYRLRFMTNSGANVGYLLFRDSTATVNLQTDGTWGVAQSQHYLSGTALTWQTLELEFVTHADYTSYQIVLLADVASAVIYFDDVELLRYRREVDCHVFLPPGGMPTARQSVGDIYQPDEQIQFGTLSFINDGWFWDRKGGTYLWHNRKVKLWVGKLSEGYDDFAAFGTALTRKPRYGNTVEMDIEDERVLLREIPTTRFNSTDYPNVISSHANKVIPILFGKNSYILPPECNTTNYTYKVSETVFGGVTYALVAGYFIVTKDGVTLVEGGGNDYTKDLNAGTFTLNADPGTASIGITCYGITISLDGALAQGYMGDWVYFLYVVLNGVSKYDMDMVSLLALNANRVNTFGDLIYSEKHSLDVLIKWKLSGAFQSYQSLEGKHIFPYYTSSVASDAPRFYGYDYASEPSLEEDTGQCFKEVIVKSHWRQYYYHHDEPDRFALENESSSDNTEWEHGVKNNLPPIESVLYGAGPGADAASLASNLQAMFASPVEVLTVTVKNPSALLLNPTDKAYFTITKKDEDGNTITVHDEQVFRILSLDKDLNSGYTTVKAIKETDDFYWTDT